MANEMLVLGPVPEHALAGKTQFVRDDNDKPDLHLLEGKDPVIGAGLSDADLAWVNELDNKYGAESDRELKEMLEEWDKEW